MKISSVIRSILFLILIVPVCVNLYAVENRQDLRLLKLHYSNSLGEKGVTTFNYDHDGKMNKALWRLINGKRNSLNYYEYNTSGLLIKKYREFSDKKTSVQTFKYDSDEKLVFEDFSRSDGVKGQVYYIYDESGGLIHADCRGLNGWFHGVIHYKYDGNGRKVSADIEQKGAKKGFIDYTYNNSGLLLREYWSFTGKWNQTFNYEYEKVPDILHLPFTSSNPFVNINTGYKISREEYDYSGKTGGPSLYEYIGNKLVKKVFIRSDGVKTETFYFYGWDNKLIASLRRYADGRSSVFTYSYNKKRQLTNRKGIGTDGFRSEENYEYDSNGKLKGAEWTNFDNWLTGSILFSHDQFGNISAGEFTGTGDKKFNGDIKFEHDKNENLSFIHWRFSFPGTQTYKFSYSKQSALK